MNSKHIHFDDIIENTPKHNTIMNRNIHIRQSLNTSHGILKQSNNYYKKCQSQQQSPNASSISIQTPFEDFVKNTPKSQSNEPQKKFQFDKFEKLNNKIFQNIPKSFTPKTQQLSKSSQSFLKNPVQQQKKSVSKKQSISVLKNIQIQQQDIKNKIKQKLNYNPKYQEEIEENKQLQNNITNINLFFEQKNGLKNAINESDMQIDNQNQQNNQNQYHFYKVKIKEGIQASLQQESVNLLNMKQNTFYYLSIYVKNQKSPLKIKTFNDIEKNKLKPKIKFFYSSSLEFPSMFNCDDMTTLKCWNIQSKSLNHFQEDYIYFCAVSDVDVELKLKYVFGEFDQDLTKYLTEEQAEKYFIMKKQKAQQKLIKKQIQNYTQSEWYMKELKEQIDEIQQKKQEKLKSKGYKIINIVRENQNNVEQFLPMNKQQNDLNKFQEKNKKIENIKEKKEILDEQNLIKKDIQNRKRNIQHAINRYAFIMSDKKQKKQRILSNWIKFIQTVNTLDKFEYCCRKRLNIMKKLQMVAIKIQVLFIRLRNRFSTQLNSNPQLRLRVDCGLSLQLATKTLKKKARFNAGKVILQLLEKRNVCFQISQQALSYRKSVMNLQKHYRNFRQKKINFMKLLGQLFDKYTQPILNSQPENNKTKKGKKVYNQETFQIDYFTAVNIQKIMNQDAKNHFIQNYMLQRQVQYIEDLKKFGELKRTLKKEMKCLSAFVGRQSVGVNQLDLILSGQKDFQIINKNSVDIQNSNLDIIQERKSILQKQDSDQQPQESEFLDIENMEQHLGQDGENKINSMVFKHDKDENIKLEFPRFFKIPKYEQLREMIIDTYYHQKKVDKNVSLEEALRK